MKVFVVICHDRRCDDAITVHSNRESADSEIEAFKARYEQERGYFWSEQNYGRDQGWVRYVNTDDDGPRARIEETEVKP